MAFKVMRKRSSMLFSNEQLPNEDQLKKLEQENLPDSVRLSVQLGELVKASKQQKEKVSVDPFVLGDMDKIENELNEFYSLSDRVGLMSGVESFNSVYGPWSSASSSSAADASTLSAQWVASSKESRLSFLEHLLSLISHDAWTFDQFDAALRSLQYVVQGVFLGCESPAAHLDSIREHCELLLSVPRLFPRVTLLLDAHLCGFLASRTAAGFKDLGEEALYDRIARLLNIVYFVCSVSDLDDARVHDGVRLDGGAEKSGSAADPNKERKQLLVTVMEAVAAVQNKIPTGFPIKKLLLVLVRLQQATFGGSAGLGRLMDTARAALGLEPVRPGLWSKNTQDDLDAFEERTASRFFGTLPPRAAPAEATAAPAGCKDLAHDPVYSTLPKPIMEAIEILYRNLYVPVGVAQLKQFTLLQSSSIHIEPLPQVSREHTADIDTLRLIDDAYAQCMPVYPAVVVALLKMFLATIPSTKKTSTGLNVTDELGAPGTDAGAAARALYDGMDMCRHKEIIAKAVSTVLINMLKMAKVAHVLQFEHLCTLIVSANGILLFLKFLNNDMSVYLNTRSEVEPLTFLSISRTYGGDIQRVYQADGECTTAAQPGDADAAATYTSWRNGATVTNVLRVLQKLTKNKASRIQVLLQYKSAGFLRRLVKLPHEPLQLYSLKLLKSQLPALGRLWRNGNMKSVTLMFQRVRTRLGDHRLVAGGVNEFEPDTMPLPDENKQTPLWVELYNKAVAHKHPAVSGRFRRGGEEVKESPVSASPTLDGELEGIDIDEEELRREYDEWVEEEEWGDNALETDESGESGERQGEGEGEKAE